MATTGKCNAAVFIAPNTPLQFQSFSLPDVIPDGAVLCQILLSTICGSDLHTASGRRIEPAPSILGHESVGEVVALGENALYWDGTPLAIGDRVSWTIMASCGSCFFCNKGLPQKCAHLIKYGHSPLSLWPGITGGYAKYIYLFPGTGIFPVPGELDDVIVAPSNCALATVICAMEKIGGVSPGESVLILGAGMLGTYLTALCKEAGAAPIMVVDRNRERARTAIQFGADVVFSDDPDPAALVNWAKDNCGNSNGVDVVFEVCGDPQVATAAIHALRIGGRIMIAGLVTPESNLTLDGNIITRKYLTIGGIHNYHPAHLDGALSFLASTVDKYPYHKLVNPITALDDINHALDLAKQGKSARVGVRC